MTLPRSVAAGMVAEPGRCCEIAWLWLSEDDFPEDSPERMLFSILIAAWEQSEGRFDGTGPHYAELLQRFLDESFPGAPIKDYFSEGVYASTQHVFEWLCERLASRNQLRRCKNIARELYWYLDFFEAKSHNAPGGRNEIYTRARAQIVIDVALERLREIRDGLPKEERGQTTPHTIPGAYS